MTTTAAQINVRLDADLKRSGDAALSKAGMTPSQAVRALWQLAASLADRPGALEDILLPSRARAEQRERERPPNVSSSSWIRGRSCSLPLAVSRESIWSRLSHRTTKSSNGMPMRIAMARR